MSRLLLVMLSIAASSVAASAATAPTTRDFVSHAEMGGEMEIQAGQLASVKAQTPGVKHFGDRMVRDHSLLAKKLKGSIAGSKDKTLPASTPLDSEAQAALQKFKTAAPADFDHIYIDSMVEDHKKDIAEFESYASSGADPAIRMAAREALPTLKDHLAMAVKIQKSLK